MMFLWTTAPKIGSKAICWALEEPVSHFSMVFDESESGFGIVFQSTLSNGVGFDWFRDFYQAHRIIYALRPKPITFQEEEKIYQSIVSRSYGAQYDWPLFAEFGFYAIRRRVTGQPLPARGRLGSKSAYLCTELGQSLHEFCPDYVPLLPGDLITPFQLYNLMKQSESLETVPWITKTLSPG
jgi:hypothetical protein